MVGVEVNPAPFTSYSTLNPDTGVTVGKLNAVLQVLGGGVIVGLDGKTTKYAVSEQMVGCAALKIALQHPGVVGVNTPVDALIVPPPLTNQVPPGGVTFSVNVTGPPPTQEFTVVATAFS
jgi:hypothetical protein